MKTEISVDLDLIYPGNVEEALPEGEFARWLAAYVLGALRRVVAASGEDSAYANMPIYYEEGNPRRVVAPDVFFVRGVPFDRRRRSYRIWESGIVPQVVFEILSKGHEFKDQVTNLILFEKIGVEEYYWFDIERLVLEARCLDPSTGRYVAREPDANGRFASSVLGLAIGIEKDVLALYRDGVYIPAVEDQLAATEERLEATEARNRELEREVERLRRKAQGGKT